MRSIVLTTQKNFPGRVHINVECLILVQVQVSPNLSGPSYIALKIDLTIESAEANLNVRMIINHQS